MKNNRVKIGSVISSCNNCRFSKVFKQLGDNYGYMLICTFSKSSILYESIDHPKHDDNPIPDTCPLDDYTGVALVDYTKEI